MTDDQKALAAELDRLSGDATRLAECVRRLGSASGAMDNLRDRLFLTVAEAAAVCDVTDQAIYNWIEHAARVRRPMAEKRANVWIIVTAQLLAYIEKHRGGLPARVEAENRLRKFWPKWSGPEELYPDEMKRAPG
ncbi:DNA-binding protein [Bradyrhizobium zhanjiangense]|uniref:DNA-binding protein n=1 Tax=Bradyrhizobium zhanjiangense TaxID=1325107 RepID=A0A4Q0QA46_9BRAD|nr:DNA-binding protein [Bradyrhizobium zhanjiangense]RXG86148.1 DNA-binding protein [Bradyrhizobium zhanjiangense]